MHWITAYSHTAQAIRKPISKLNQWELAELSRDVLGLIGLTVWAVAWIGLMVYLAT